jgi:hypothetical protein
MRVLDGNGGAFGLYGPRGSGKSWLMRRAIHEADSRGGMGLWFPCPSDYDPSDFLSSLSDNLANAVEHRFIQGEWRVRWRRQAQFLLAVLVAILIAVQVAAYYAHVGLNRAWMHWMWIGVSVFIVAWLLLVLIALTFPTRRVINTSHQLAREATALRERIRYTTALKLNSEVGVSGGSKVAGSLKRSTERALAERPTTVASLVFDFRKLAERIVATIQQPLVIGIDELDKVEDPEAVRKLLRDIKGIFEITGVFFLVSVSEEAANALQLGPLQGRGRNEFNSSFYTVLELPPLSPAEVMSAVKARGGTADDQRAQLLCLLSGGNWREMVRLTAGTGLPDDPDSALAISTLAAEVAALQREIIRAYGGGGEATTVLPDVWRALPSRAFDSPDAFDALSRTAVRDHWDLVRGSQTWQDVVSEPWRRVLIRLFVIGRVIAATQSAARPALTIQPFSDTDICDLRDVLIMAGHSSSVALLMLQARFTDDLSGPYAAPPGHPKLRTCQLVSGDVVSPEGGAVEGGWCCPYQAMMQAWRRGRVMRRNLGCSTWRDSPLMTCRGWTIR